jgi:diguanylate cyclase (GGDEF)-like protein
MFVLASISLFSCILNYAYTATHAIYYPNEILGIAILLFLWIFNYPLKWVIAVPLVTLISYYFVFFALDNHISHEKETSIILLTFTFLIGLFYSVMNGANEYRLFKSFKNAEAQALTDSLTNMYNRKGFLQKFDYIKKIAKRENRKTYIAILDIDNFKKINDNYGHDIGDNVITMVAAKILELFRRPLDLTARWGGEEFIISWCEENPETIQKTGERICQTIANTQIPPLNNLTVTVSVGIALLNEHDFALNDTLKRADIALYTAKHNGKNQSIIA